MDKQNYQKIVNELIKNSFPSLKNRNVKIIEFPEFFGIWSFVGNGFKNHYIFINKHRKNAEVNSLKSQLAHELSHIYLNHLDKSFLSSWFHNFRKFSSWFFNTCFSREIETKTDKETIKRGYAKKMLIFAKEWENLFSKKALKRLYSRGYFSPEQIKSYAKKIGKW